MGYSTFDAWCSMYYFHRHLNSVNNLITVTSSVSGDHFSLLPVFIILTWGVLIISCSLTREGWGERLPVKTEAKKLLSTFRSHHFKLERATNFHSFLEMRRRGSKNLSHCYELSLARINFVLRNTRMSDMVWVLSTLVRKIIWNL